MSCDKGFTESKSISATVLFTIIWAMSVVVNAKEGYKHQATVDIENGIPERRFYLDEEATNKTANSKLKIEERSWWDIFDPLKTFVQTVAFKLFGPGVIKENQGNHTCYRDVCFFPEYGLGLEVGGPITPEIENTTFIFFDGRNSSGEEVNETTWESYFKNNFSGDISKPLIAIVHGLNGNRNSPWVVTLRDSLFENVNCNVLVVDWKERADFFHYAKAASSAPLVGVLLSFMLRTIIETTNCSLRPDNVHIIGFSLGAHAAGVCGRHFYNTTGFLLGRITGLDPAGPLFEGSNVSLSASDAAFVDVIQTNAGNLSEEKFGLNKSIGHVDFYPNGGSEQPGCKHGSETDIEGCSHKRAHTLFTQSLYKNCSFTSYFCKDGWTKFLSGPCSQEKNKSYIGEMGYYSINASGRGNQYLNTSDKSPFCINKTQG